MMVIVYDLITRILLSVGLLFNSINFNVMNSEIIEHTLTQQELDWHLWNAMQGPNLEDIKKYIDLGADKNLRNIQHLKPIHFAIIYDHREAINYLLKKGVDIEAKDDDGRTPLHHAVRYYKGLEIIKLLIAHGAKRDSKDYRGRTPCGIAQNSKKLEIMNYFIEIDPKTKISEILMLRYIAFVQPRFECRDNL